MPYAIINVYFDRIADKIHEHANRGGRTIIHCVCGISRAASITIAYLMKYKKMTLRSAHDFVLSRRPCIRPNPGFWRQLQDYEKRLNGASQTHAVRRDSSTNRNTSQNNGIMGRQGEISIPIHIINSNTDSNIYQQPRQSRSGSVGQGLNSTGYTVSDYIVPSHGYAKPQQQRYNSSNTYSRDYTSVMPNPSNKSFSSTKLFDDYNALHSIPIPPKSEYVSYESSTAKGYTYPNGNHRTSLYIDSFNEPKYTSVKPSNYSTAYRSIMDRF